MVDQSHFEVDIASALECLQWSVNIDSEVGFVARAFLFSQI